MAVLMTPLYYQYPYSLQSLQTEVEESNLKMEGYFIFAFWSHNRNKGLQSHVGFSSQEKQYSCHEQLSLSSFPTGSLRGRAEHAAQAGPPNRQLQRNSTETLPKCWLMAKPEIKQRQRTAGSTAEPMARRGHGDRSGKMQTTNPSSGPRGAHACFRAYFYLMLGIATF